MSLASVHPPAGEKRRSHELPGTAVMKANAITSKQTSKDKDRKATQGSSHSGL